MGEQRTVEMKMHDNTVSSLARLDERMRAIESNLEELKMSVTANIESLRQEIRAGLGTMHDIQKDHERRITILEAAERARQEAENQRLSWLRPVVTGIITAAALAVLGALAWVITHYSPIFR